MVVIVFDTCTLIDLDIPEVDLLTQVMDLNEKDVNFIISETNFKEIHSMKIRRLIESTDSFEIKKIDSHKCEIITQDLEELKINLSNDDRQILILAISEKADYIVTSDIPVFDKAARYRKFKNIKYMEPMTTVGLIHLLYRNELIDSSIFFEKSLNLFKFKEIDNILSHLSKEPQSSSSYRIDETVKRYKEMMKQRFQIYKNPLVKEYKVLKEKGLITI